MIQKNPCVLQVGLTSYFPRMLITCQRHYITKNGNLFLHDKGGTRYTDDHTSATSRGENIIPVYKIKAYKYLEDKKEYQIIEEYSLDEIEEA